jgi:hypothetical protein
LIGFVAVGAPATPAASAPGLPPLPPLPPPPSDGTVLSDILGPAATGGCDSVALVFALAAPIAGAQLTPELKELVDQITPYLSLATYACGFLVSPPSAFKCAPDKLVADTAAKLNLSQLGVPVNIPEAAKVTYDTAAGIENIFLRLGIPIDQPQAFGLAKVLGCTVPPPVVDPPAAAAPTFPSTAGTSGTPASTSFVAIGSPVGSLPSTVSVGGSRTLPAVTTKGPARYPIDGRAAALLALPLVLLAAAGVVGPRLRKRAA